MKFYISAKWQMQDEVRRIFSILEKRGHKITEDWTRHIVATPYGNDVALSGENAEKDEKGVRDSDVYVHISDVKGVGMYVELGSAITSNILTGKPLIYLIGNHDSKSQFYFHPSVRIRKSIEDVLEEVEK